MNVFFLEPKSFGGEVKVEIGLSNYATKVNLKNAKGVDIWKFAKKVDLASLKSEVDKLDTYKLEKVPIALKRLKNKEDKLEVDKLVPVSVVSKDVYDAKIKDVKDKRPDIY